MAASYNAHAFTDVDDKYAKKSPTHAHAFINDVDDKYAKKPAMQSLKVVAPPCHNAPTLGDDDKYGKYESTHKHIPEPLQKYHNALNVFSIRSVAMDGGLAVLLLGFVFFMLAAGAAYLAVGGEFTACKMSKFVSVNLEVLGLLMLRHKIQLRGNVSGISGMTMVMYAFVYGIRIFLSMPSSWDFVWKDVDFDAWFAAVSLILVFIILKSIFVTHRSTYQDDLDVLKVQYLVPGCCFLALLVRPSFHQWTFEYGMSWSVCFYIDIFALVPQVVMMARGGGKVEAPIAHFVAATFLSRLGDIIDSLAYENDLRITDCTSYWTVVIGQALHLILVADFMYLYLKARASGAKLLEDLKIVADNIC